MQKVGAACCWVSVATLILLFIIFPIRGAEVDIGSIARSPAQFDGKSVTVRGTASAVKETVSRAGNPYATLQVQDKTGGIKVFTFGHPGIKAGDCVEATGVYQQVKRVGQHIFYNEIEAQNVAATRC
jgi:DNA/RNA endonuclease YhcR with UshA esterase domain